MEESKGDKKGVSNNINSNSLSKMLSSYLPKDVLDEIDINDSSKTNSLSKNSSSDNSMGKSTKSQTNNNNNGNNNNSDSNNSGSNNNKGNNSDSSGNSKNDIFNIHLRKIYNSYPKKESYHIKHKLFKYFFRDNRFQKINNQKPKRNIYRSFSWKNINTKSKKIKQKNKSTNTIKKIEPVNKNNIEENKINIIQNNQNTFSNSNSKWNKSNEDSSKQLKLIYSHPNLNTYKYSNNSNEFNILNNSMNNLNNNNFYETTINNTDQIKIGRNQNGNKRYKGNNNININGFYNHFQNGSNGQYSSKSIRNYNISNVNNVNKSNNNNSIGDLYQYRNINNGINHHFNYVDNVNNEVNNSLNGNEMNNFYNIFQKSNGEINFKNKDFQNLFYNLNPLNNNSFNMNYPRNNNINRNNHNNININEQNPNNNTFNKYLNLINQNSVNLNGNFINHFPNSNGINFIKSSNQGKKINLTNTNQNYNGNYNHSNIFMNKNMNHDINLNIERNSINDKNELNDSQIDYLFNQLYSLPEEVCLLLYIINKKSVSFFVKLAKTMKGSKYLQNILQSYKPKDIEIDCVTKIICTNYNEIMCDNYGNYFLQKFFPFCNEIQRIKILISIKNDFINIANHICGNHSLQCLISLQSTKEEKEIIKIYTQNNLKDLCKGGNSSHVVSKIINILKESERQYMNNFLINNLIELCIDSNGVCVVKEFLYNIESDNYLKAVISTFEKETSKLTFNQFGNFIIQEVIRFFGYNYCKNIINNLINNLVEFSLSKFSSNVIDFLLEYLSKKQFWEFCNILEIIFLNEKNFKVMIKNKFSIYVIENCLELLIKINENYYINSVRNNLGYSKKSEKEDKENDEEFSYENFLKLKKQIFQFIENNSAAKEKKQILALIKSYKNKRF